jgi:alpha-galactosidase
MTESKVSPLAILASWKFGDIRVEYVMDGALGSPGLNLIPDSQKGDRVTPRSSLRGAIEIERNPNRDKFPRPRNVEPLVQLKWQDDAYPRGFSNGHTLRNSTSIEALKFSKQSTVEAGDTVEIVTLLEAPGCAEVEHHLKWKQGTDYLEIWTEVVNVSECPQTLQMLSSFTLGGITPFAPDDAPGRLHVHRFRSQWSAEARLETNPVEKLGLERSWAGYSCAVEKFGQVGSMPVRRFFPFVAVEDTVSETVWAASLTWGGSWQIELSREDDSLVVSGGLADEDFGRWCKTLQPGERFHTPGAMLTVVAGDLTEACQNLVQAQEPEEAGLPPEEKAGAIIFNDWCHCWGEPTLEKVTGSLERLSGTPVRYFVIDAGWFNYDRTHGVLSAQGDWNVDLESFPTGLKGVADLIRSKGLLPGLWFEMETCGKRSETFHQSELLLHRDGHPLIVNGRAFLDLRKPKVREHLRRKVLDTLLLNGFHYLKVDYNDSIGVGADGSESLGESLREVVEQCYAIFDEIRAAGITIENCSSGGHRAVHGFISRSHQFSFSDAHETLEIPVIAAAMQQLTPAAKAQIWAVLHPEDDRQRLEYSLAATFLGRMCLSGPVECISAENWRIVETAMDFYADCWPVIRRGRSRSFGPTQLSLRRLKGWQACRRSEVGGNRHLIVVHTFEDAPKQPIEVPLPSGEAVKSVRSFPAGIEVECTSGKVSLSPLADFSAVVILMET